MLCQLILLICFDKKVIVCGTLVPASHTVVCTDQSIKKWINIFRLSIWRRGGWKHFCPLGGAWQKITEKHWSSLSIKWRSSVYPFSSKIHQFVNSAFVPRFQSPVDDTCHHYFLISSLNCSCQNLFWNVFPTWNAKMDIYLQRKKMTIKTLFIYMLDECHP